MKKIKVIITGTVCTKLNGNVVTYNPDGTELSIMSKFKNNYAPKESKIKKINSDYQKLDTCSCCGERKEKVDRNKNIGMCPDCWDKNKNNKKMKNFSFINNFRLKRNKKWVDEKFKKTDKKYVIQN